jgi:hypothetical protein
LIKSSFFKKQYPKKGIDKLFPFALAYIPVSSIFAFIFDELPLKFYGPPEIVYDTEASGGLGPQSVNMESLVSAGTYLFSVAFNFLAWIFCLVVIIGHYIVWKKQSQNPLPDE